MDPSVSASPSKDRAEYSELMKKVMTALFYGASSFMIMVVNKTVLTKFEFPSFQVLGIGQMVATIIILYVTKKLNYISFPDLSTDTFRKIWPLPLMYLGELEILHLNLTCVHKSQPRHISIGNMVFGLGGTQNLSLPMMTVLRRFSILMTMIGNLIILS